MSLKLISTDIIIIAKEHNPSIITKEWLYEKKIIEEEFIDFLHSPRFSFFESESFSLNVNPQRFQIFCKKKNQRYINLLTNIAKKYINILPEIPYKSLGLNFIWEVSKDENINPPDIIVNFSSLNNLSKLFNTDNINCGAIIHTKYKNYILRLTINPKIENKLVYIFNYHHNIEKLKIDSIKMLIDNHINLYKNSKKIVKDSYIKNKNLK